MGESRVAVDRWMGESRVAVESRISFQELPQNHLRNVFVFCFFYFLRQDMMELKQASNSLCG